MLTPREEIEAAVTAALNRLLGPESEGVDPLVRPTQDPRFGDYQSNVALGLARQLGRKPREVAESLAAALDLPACEPPEIAGPGFLNFRLRPDYVAARLAARQADPRLGVPLPERAQRIIIDYSSPNVAKEMHVGHLRSTIIGDTYARVLRFLGHDVLALNHIGDWGTQFGMLIQHLRESEPDALAHPERFRVDDLEGFYRAAKTRFDADPEFAAAARRAVVDLQSGDPAARTLWLALCDESMRHAAEVYERLGIRDLVTRGESFYNPMLPEVVDDLTARGLAVEDQGALCVFLEGRQVPLMVRKSGGGFGYDATDLAGVKHRVEVERAERIIYVTDIRQRQHFELVFEGARKAGYAPPSVSLEHAGFGMVTGADKKPYKSRSGDTVKLASLLDEAESRALAAIAEGRGDLSEADRRRIARIVGIGGVKYADLCHNITSDYVFDWDTMLALEGNTAPYMLYAYARIRSIGRRAGVDLDALPADLELRLEHPSELALGKELLLFPGVVRQVADELRPHHLTDYLYSLSRAFSTFYDRERGVRVVDAAPEVIRLSRLRLCDLTARTLRLGLSFLGIETVEQM
jgi:arginyl-tRNA synthetase